MDMMADIFLIAGALGAGVYCLVLARRLRRFTDLETGVGGAIAVLSVQVDDMTKALGAAQTSAATTSGTLDALTARAEDAARRLELLVAAMHDLPADAPSGRPGTVPRQQPADAAPPDPRTEARSASTGVESTHSPDTTGSDDKTGLPTFFLSQRARIREAAE